MISTPTSVIVSLLLLLLPGKVFFGWSNGIPSLDKKIVFEESYRSIADPAVLLKTIPACSCEVKDNVNVTIAGHTLKS
jgi:hypothetical protein